MSTLPRLERMAWVGGGLLLGGLCGAVLVALAAAAGGSLPGVIFSIGCGVLLGWWGNRFAGAAVGGLCGALVAALGNTLGGTLPGVAATVGSAAVLGSLLAWDSGVRQGPSSPGGGEGSDRRGTTLCPVADEAGSPPRR